MIPFILPDRYCECDSDDIHFTGTRKQVQSIRSQNLFLFSSARYRDMATSMRVCMYGATGSITLQVSLQFLRCEHPLPREEFARVAASVVWRDPGPS